MKHQQKEIYSRCLKTKQKRVFSDPTKFEDIAQSSDTRHVLATMQQALIPVTIWQNQQIGKSRQIGVYRHFSN